MRGAVELDDGVENRVGSGDGRGVRGGEVEIDAGGESGSGASCVLKI